MRVASNRDWLNKASVKSLIEIIDTGNNQSRFVGGCVRDSILGRPVSDIDIATRHSPDKIMQLLSSSNIIVRPTGIKHGTVSAFLDDQVFEITSLRRDLKTDGRRAEISFTDSWTEDAARRDFTMNALFMDKHGNIFDPVGGYKDVIRGRVCFVGDASRRIQEDFLRVLRFFRFYAYFGQEQIDRDGLAACKKFAGELKALSGERIQSELFKIILSTNAFTALSKMSENKIMSKIFPGRLRMSEFSRLVFLEGADSDPIRRLAILLTTPAEKVIETLKLSNRMADHLTFYCEKEIDVSEEPKEIKRLFYEMRKMDLLGLLLIKTALNPKYKKMRDVANTIAQNWSVPTFPLRGLDLLKLGMKPGIEVGNILMKVEHWWILSEFKYNKEDCLNWVKDHYVNES